MSSEKLAEQRERQMISLAHMAMLDEFQTLTTRLRDTALVDEPDFDEALVVAVKRMGMSQQALDEYGFSPERPQKLASPGYKLTDEDMRVVTQHRTDVRRNICSRLLSAAEEVAGDKDYELSPIWLQLQDDNAELKLEIDKPDAFEIDKLHPWAARRVQAVARGRVARLKLQRLDLQQRLAGLRVSRPVASVPAPEIVGFFGRYEDEEDEDDVEEGATLLLGEEEIKLYEWELGLATEGTMEERAERAARAIRCLKAELRLENNGKVSKNAKCRHHMQGAWARAAAYKGSRWLPATFLPMERARYDTDLRDGSLRGGLIQALQEYRREAAFGASYFGVLTKLRSYRELRDEQNFDEAYKFFTAAGGGFETWSKLELERALLWGALEHRVAAWGGATPGSLLWRIAIAAACYFGEAAMMALLLGGAPTAHQDDARGWYHHIQCDKVLQVFSEVFEEDGTINPKVVPEGRTLELIVFQRSGTRTAFRLTIRSDLVAAVAALRRGADGVPRASSVVQESEARSQRLAEELVDGLEGKGGVPRALMPGGRAWQLELRSTGVVDKQVLCDRGGWHDGRMAEALGLPWPPEQPMTPNDVLLQPAESGAARKQHAAHLTREKRLAESALQAAGEAAPSQSGAAAVVKQLIKLAAGRADEPRKTELQLEEAVSAASAITGKLGDVAAAFVEAAFARTMHDVLPQAKGGMKGGRPRTLARAPLPARTLLARHRHAARPHADDARAPALAAHARIVASRSPHALMTSQAKWPALMRSARPSTARASPRRP